MSEEIFDAFVVGGALSGPRTAELIAESGKSVKLVEENFDVGHPCKCTGLVSWRIKELLPVLPEKLIINTHREARFHAPNGSSFVLKSKRPVYLLDRPGLDRHLFEMANEAGVETMKSEKFLSYKLMDDHVEIETDKKTYKARVLIGADGANSAVGKQAGFTYPESYLVGVQTTAHGNFDKVELWFGSKVSPNFFAWVAPENENIARIGLATNRNSSKYYEDFLKFRVGEVVKPDVGGVIRYGLMEKTSTDRVMVVGDAACQVKPYSGGGIIFGLTSSKICAEAAISALRQKKFGEKFLRENYDDIWKKKIGGAIKRGMTLNKMLSASDGKVSLMMKMGRLGSRFLSRVDMDLINYFV